MTPREATECLGGLWNEQRGLAPCPVPGHGKGRGDLNWSLSIRAGDAQGLLVHCFAGCDAVDVLAALRRIEPGRVWADPNHCRQRRSVCGSTRANAIELWRKGLPVAGTPAEQYLVRRGLTLPLRGLRYMPDAWHAQAERRFPALLSALTADCADNAGRISALQRTFLTAFGEKAPVEPPRMILGQLNSAAVRLAPAAETLGIAEGVETALAATQLFKVPCWAGCGARLHRVTLPSSVSCVILFADNDGAGLRTADRAAHRFRREGRTVEVRVPQLEGGDWNDVLIASWT